MTTRFATLCQWEIDSALINWFKGQLNMPYLQIKTERIG